MKPKIAIVRGKFLNAYEMQFYEPLVKRFDLTGFGSLHPYHEDFAFPVEKLSSPMDLSDFPYKMPILNRLFVDAHYLFGLEEKLRGFDIVHTAETYFHYTQQCLNAKKKGYVRKVIATVLENIPFNNEGIWVRKEFKRRARQELDHIVALTNKTKDTLITEGADPKKITVISHFVDTKRFTPTKTTIQRRSSATPTDLVIMFSGRLESYKGVFDILEAASRIRKDPALRRFSLRYLFVGNGTQRKRMIEEEDRLGLSQVVTHSSVSYSEMPALYEKADIFLAPSKPTPTYDEQYCTALLEAQAAGLAIVTTRTGGIPENIGDAGILIPPGDVTAMSRSIKSLVLDAKLRARLGQKARRRAEKVHDITIGARKLTDLYLSLLRT